MHDCDSKSDMHASSRCLFLNLDHKGNKGREGKEDDDDEGLTEAKDGGMDR